MTDRFLAAAARAHALICRADGRVEPFEALSFAGAVGDDPAFATYTPDQLKAAATQAFASIAGDESFDDIALEIAGWVKAPSQRAAIIRVARAAIVADSVRREQEDDAIRALAAALKFDIDKA